MSAWQPIKTAPRDGTEFQAWIVSDYDGRGWWEPRCRFEEYGAFQIWDRVDYDIDDWSFTPNEPTHWMPLPEPPSSPREGGE